jgi:Acetyltransferase (GNAT) domain
MSNRELFRLLSEGQPELPLFLRPWWLDVTCGPERWDAAMVSNGNELDGVLPFLIKTRAGFTILTQPQLTQFLGPWIRSTGGKSTTDLARQKDIMFALIEQLPPHDHYAQNWSWKTSNWIPFYWKGFRQTTKYTYALENLQDLDGIWKGLQENIRTDVRKATNRFNVVVDNDANINDFLALNRMTFARQGMPLPYTENYVRSIDAACGTRNCRKVLVTRDAEGRPHAGVYLVWDQNSAYYLMGGGDPELRNSGATSLCMWEAIKFAAGVTRRFDFEGSMIEPVERFFRGFGGRQVPYFQVSKTNSRLLRIREALHLIRGRSA